MHEEEQDERGGAAVGAGAAGKEQPPSLALLETIHSLLDSIRQLAQVLTFMSGNFTCQFYILSCA